METLPWTYEVAPAGADAGGLEEYVVETADGDDVGKVHVVLEREGDAYVVVERGSLPPAARELVVVPAEDVESVDNVALRVRLRARGEDDLAALGHLDPAKGIERSEGDDVEVDARRLADITGLFAPETVSADSPRAADTSRLPLAIGTGILAGFLLLLTALLATAGEERWQWVTLVLAAILAIVAGTLAYRAWRRPYVRV